MNKKVVAVVGVLVALLVLILVLRHLDRGNAKKTKPTQAAAGNLAGEAPTSFDLNGNVPSGQPTGITVPEGVVEQNSEALRAAVEEYKHLHRYGIESRPLTREMIDVLDPNIFWPVPHPVVGQALLRKAGMATQDKETQDKIMGEAIWQSFEADRARYVEDQPVTLTLATYRGEGEDRQPIDVLLNPVQISLVGEDGKETAFGQTELSRLRPKVPTDPQYGTVWTAPPALRDFVGFVKFTITWNPTDGGDPSEAFLTVHYTGSPPGRFLGTFADKLEQGSLVIDVGVEILRKEEGTYQFDGRLFAADGVTPLAYASGQATLAEGEHVVPLLFYGLALREAQVSGPYVLKGVTGYLMATGSAGRGPEIRANWDAYRTKGYDYRSFTDKEWTSPEQDARIEVYEKMIRDAEEAERNAGRPQPSP